MLLHGGTLIRTDPAGGRPAQGDLLVEDGRIADIGPALDVPDAERLDAAGMLVLPGFVDTHRHTWQTAFRGLGADWSFEQYRIAMHGTLRPHYRPEDVHLGTLVGRIEALSSGVTTMLDWFHCADHPENADAAIDALREAPGRSLFCYGAGNPAEPDVTAEIRRVRSRLPDDEMVMGLRGPAMTSLDTTSHDVALARELDLRVSFHLHTRASGGRDLRHLAAMAERGLLDDRTTVVHGNGLSDDQLALMADAGCSVSISPDVEVKMGFGPPETGRMLAAGIRPSFSIDDCPSAGGDMFATMRSALAVQRGLDGGLTCRDVLSFATLDGARTLGLGATTGSIAVGKAADLVLLDAEDISLFPVNDAVGTVVAAGHPGVVDTVLVAGEVVKRGGRLLGVDLPALRTRLLGSRDRIAAAAGVAVDGSWTPTTT